ncbi:MAG: hypothetical protein COV59_03340 [Candidatus Magasanikbacteria bacterium CG11_big_fil_rev_8_21_14_0_20_39_34]|uniref:Methyltransferase type 11 domain-containing protein n=1 Tax=Candidatus Magasanikbacteria bacterium CG11_big_fil_rev_8_21_14_0_20_39_34 TaxID=1974653 RepID=A0A2H0N5M5_9BACT|nr:MAG: hypothetical protein COV59_03340 [Candidatus Magasanikbacteria bacterium CG11_big_fil_rev_8_21_14_0_20_39_34]
MDERRMQDLFHTISQDITNTPENAAMVYRSMVSQLNKAGRKDILDNPILLDLGGGKGELSKYLNQQGVTSISLDYDSAGVSAEANPVKADAYHMPFADSSIDIVHGRGTFDDTKYTHDFPKLIAEIARVLKPKGILSIMDYSPPPDTELEKFFKRLTDPDDDTFALWEKRES